MATRTLARRVSIGQYPGRLEVQTVEEYVHRRLGVDTGTVHNWMYGDVRANKRAAVIVEAMVATNQAHRADRWLTEVYAARQGVLPLELSEAVIMQAVNAEYEAAKARNLYRGTQTRESLVEYRRRLKIEIAEKMRLLKAIETELGSRCRPA